jgi:hypothetical protein
MTQAEAKMRIGGVANMGWPSGGRSSHTSAESSVFSGAIKQNHPDLLSFESSDDKRQLIKRWLVDAGLIKG